jgi:hypothetical protein
MKSKEFNFILKNEILQSLEKVHFEITSSRFNLSVSKLLFERSTKNKYSFKTILNAISSQHFSHCVKLAKSLNLPVILENTTSVFFLSKACILRHKNLQRKQVLIKQLPFEWDLGKLQIANSL